MSNPYNYMNNGMLELLVANRLFPFNLNWDVTTQCMYQSFTRGQTPVPFTFDDARKVLAMSDGTAEDEAAKLYDYFWGQANTAPAGTTIIRPLGATSYVPNELPMGNQPDLNTRVPCTHHQWVEVVLFNTTTERCKLCDIKKPV